MIFKPNLFSQVALNTEVHKLAEPWYFLQIFNKLGYTYLLDININN